jgi:predicted ATPase/class 3 adenylate cyclase/DNA-binding CsgD family transcriptional regulator
MSGLPGGSVTFLFTDIEGSTRLVKALRERYARVLAEHRGLVRAAIAAHGGHEVDTQGDAFFAAFGGAKQAVLCALEIQRVLAAHDWPAGAQVRVRMGIHTGQAVPAEGGYTGLAVHRAARICAAARGGQVLVSQATQDLIEDEEEGEDLGFALVDVGEHLLKDLDRPVRLFQLAVAGLDPSASLAGARRPAGLPEKLTAHLPAGDVGPGTGSGTGLPAEVSSLVGRGPEIAAVRERLRGGRVVTLTGPGGCGKTRLALRVATLAGGSFEDGARLVELASLTDPALVPAFVAEALGVPEQDAPNPMAVVARALADRELLIVLDNCEHVLGAAARVVVTLAGQCRRVRILATSRERLDVPGEAVFPVPPLGLPEDGSVRAVARSEAGSLFVARTGAASPGFVLGDGNAAAIAEVCSRLDGMPLAIELAAARCPALGPAQLAARLEGHPGLLSGGAARPGRHRSLEALVAWSYDLLGDAERRLLDRLSVLRGGFDLEVAERVCGGQPLAPEAIAGLLASLAGKSLVQIQAGPVIRYSLLETVRQFAAGQLAASGEETAVHARLLRWALEVARSADAAQSVAERAGWSARLTAHQASIRAALSWALGGQEPEAGRELAARLARWWIATGRYSEAGQFLTAAASLLAPAAPGIQARVLLGAAWSAYHLGENSRAAPLADDGITRAREAGEPQLEAWGRNLRAGLAWYAGDADRIVAELEASRALSSPVDPALAARAQVLLANAAFLSGDLAEQDRRRQRAIELARTAAGQEGLALALTGSAMPAIAGAGIQPATVAALDEAATVLAAHPDRFAETVMRRWRAELFATLGQLDAAETEVRLCWAAGRSGALRLVEIIGPLAEARLAAARDDIAAAAGALRQAADGGRRVDIVMFLPVALAGLACLAAIAGDEDAAAAAVAEARAELGGRRQAITLAALRYAEGVMAWHRGELTTAEHLAREATVQWHRSGDRMDACDGIELLGVLAAARERYADAARLLAAADAARRPLQYLAPGFTADRDAAARAVSQARHVLGDDGFTQAWELGQALALDDAVAYAARKGGGRKRPATGWASLTPAEVEVVRLVSEGLRNDAIARRLFIAPGTVKVHLSHIFAKLSITTRAELAAQAASRDLTTR